MAEQTTPPCEDCQSEYTYENGEYIACPMCGHEWLPGAETDAGVDDAAEGQADFKDSVGNVLVDGDSVVVSQTLKVKGGKDIPRGTKVPNIRLLDMPVNGHDIDARIPGFGQVYLKTSVVRKGG